MTEHRVRKRKVLDTHNYATIILLMILMKFRYSVLTDMKEKLSFYIVECFLVSGSDDIESIVEMNIDDVPKNSINVIESYIDKGKASLPQCIGPNQLPNTPFEFRSGHRIRIEKSIHNIKCKYGVKKSMVKETKGKSKKRKLEVTDCDDVNI